MKQQLDKENPSLPHSESTDAESLAGSTRRRFTRTAVFGSAAFLSLSNRPAWSGNSTCVAQVSKGFMNSVTHNSHDPDGESQSLYNSKIADWQVEVADNLQDPNAGYTLSIGPDPTNGAKHNPDIQCLISTRKK